MKRTRTYSPYAIDAVRLLGARVRIARRERRWTEQNLCDRVGITPNTLRKIERGDVTVGIGVVFEVATLVGVCLFHDDSSRVAADLDRARDRLALLPARVRSRPADVNDDF